MMEHPLIGSLAQVSTEDLGKKVSELTKKLSIAQQSGNQYLCNQLRMAIDTYQTAYSQRLQDSYRKAEKEINFDNKINIA